ncbi:MAG: dTDP-4-dehydrorhamnose 3,5-epimerase [Alphaproteobacteria bacterium]|nr:dTDP-4-dehydrorhamnose 3,5-epimerase [Alphaproteobacteria bacterium]
MLSVQNTPIAGLLLIEPETAHDLRGITRPVFHPTQYAAFGMTGRFASDRYVRSFQGSLRGMYILPDDQQMLLNLVRGDVTLVVADVREGSRSFGAIQMIDITEAQNRQVYIAGGLAYATLARSDIVDMHEKYTGFYDAQSIRGLFWKDASLNIQWPIKYPLVSENDARFQSLKELTTVCV